MNGQAIKLYCDKGAAIPFSPRNGETNMEFFKRLIDCEYIEAVRPHGLPEPYCMIVDEEGMLKPNTLNVLASWLYGYVEHGQPIVGNALIVKEGIDESGENDFLLLDEKDVQKVSAKYIYNNIADHASAVLYKYLDECTE